MRRLASCAPVIGLLAWGVAAHAAEVTVAGITFGDAEGGFVLESASGAGRLDDPFVVVERITGNGEAALTIEGLTAVFGNRVGTAHLTGFALVKVVRNATNETWRDYPVELQEHRGDQSPYGDGLSFAQGPFVTRSIRTDRFAAAQMFDEPRDLVLFHDGAVAPGETVTLRVVITDNTPAARFYVVQRRLQPTAALTPSRQPVGSCCHADAPRRLARVP